MELFYLLLLLGLYTRIENPLFLIIVCLNIIFWGVSHLFVVSVATKAEVM